MALSFPAMPRIHSIGETSLPLPKDLTPTLKHYLYQNDPLITLTIQAQGGDGAAPNKFYGLLINQLFKLEKIGDQKFIHIIEQYGGFFAISQTHNFNELIFTILERHLVHVLPLLSQILKNPQFKTSDLTFVQNQLYNKLQNTHALPYYRAAALFKQSIFGKRHPYGHTTLSLDLLHAIKRKDIELYYCNHFWRNPKLLISGDPSPASLQVIQQFTETLPSACAPLPNLPSIKTGPVKKQITLPNNLQATLCIGKKLPSIHHTNYTTLLFINYLIAGYFGGRIMQKLREDRAYTYGVQSSIDSHYRDLSLFFLQTHVNKEHLPDTLEIIEKELAQLHNELVPEKEIKQIQRFFAGALRNNLDGKRAIHHIYNYIDNWDLPATHYNQRYRTMMQMTPSKIQQAVQQYFDPDTFTHAVVV